MCVCAEKTFFNDILRSCDLWKKELCALSLWNHNTSFFFLYDEFFTRISFLFSHRRIKDDVFASFSSYCYPTNITPHCNHVSFALAILFFVLLSLICLFIRTWLRFTLHRCNYDISPGRFSSLLSPVHREKYNFANAVLSDPVNRKQNFVTRP